MKAIRKALGIFIAVILVGSGALRLSAQSPSRLYLLADWRVDVSRAGEFEACNREWIALSRAKGALDPFLTYMGGIGTRMPVYVWLEYGRRAADYASAEDSFWTAMGEEGAALSKRTRAAIRTRESRTGSYRPDLSYAPKADKR
jgi:hypothetical protein